MKKSFKSSQFPVHSSQSISNWELQTGHSERELEMETKLRNKRLDEKEFLKMRAPFLAQWRTGREVDLDEAVEYQRKLPDSKSPKAS
jgi:hypothetical protein